MTMNFSDEFLNNWNKFYAMNQIKRLQGKDHRINVIGPLTNDKNYRGTCWSSSCHENLKILNNLFWHNLKGVCGDIFGLESSETISSSQGLAFII